MLGILRKYFLRNKDWVEGKVVTNQNPDQFLRLLLRQNARSEAPNIIEWLARDSYYEVTVTMVTIIPYHGYYQSLTL